ncbi:MAG: heat-inducible transcription repressor HrcA, partial [Candidatus Hydrogenedentes bacterium]|nr:heat-inducible transcription repressor HrcA [Candidatus Hydrogenedentota bacterium]
MPHSKLTEREQLILQAVVHLYVTTAEPVGSRAIVKRFELDISPATVRNVMADLEDMGFLQQRHTSSGRIPTDNGYRHYVDCLMSIQELTQSERSRIETHLTDQLNDADALLRQTSYLLALISHQTSIVEAPSLNVAQVEHVEIVPISEHRLAFLLADNYGGVRTMVLQTSKRITPDDAQRLNRFLNEHFRHTPIDAFSSSLESKLHAFIDEQRRLAEQALRLRPNDADLYLRRAEEFMQAGQYPQVIADVTKAIEVLANGNILVGDLVDQRLKLFDSSTGAYLGEFTTDPIIGDVLDIDEQPNGDIVISTPNYQWNERPGEPMQLEYPYVIAPLVHGDWYEAAELYRIWATGSEADRPTWAHRGRAA